MATTDELLDLDVVSARGEAVRFALLDVNHTEIGEVHPQVAVRVQNNTAGSVKRTLQGFRLDPSEAADVNPISDRIRPYWVLENGDQLSLGIFLFGKPSQRRYSYGLPLDDTPVDQGLILAQPIQETIGFSIGTLVTDAIRQVAAAAGFPNAVVDASTTTLLAPQAWAPGKSNTYAKVLSDLCALAGFYDWYFTNDGDLRCRRATDLSTATSTLRYEDGGRIVAGSMVESNDLLEAPNRYIVLDTSMTLNPVAARYDLPPTAPHAVQHRGFAIPKFIEAPGIGNGEQALALAESTAQQDVKAYETVQFTSPADPRHDTFDVVQYRGNLYIELSWSITCAPGGPMEHTIKRVYL